MRILFVITTFILPFWVMAQSTPDPYGFQRKIVSQFSADTGGYLPLIKLLDENGMKRSLADFKGKIVYIHVWDTECENSIDMFPYEAQLRKRLKALHLDSCIQLIDICSGTSKRKWKKALAKYSPEGSNLYLTDRKKWNVKSWPTYILLDTNGKVTGRHITSPEQSFIIDFILYSATKGINPVQAAWMELTGGAFNGVTATDEKARMEFKVWHTSLAPLVSEFFQWRKEHEQQGSQ